MSFATTVLGIAVHPLAQFSYAAHVPQPICRSQRPPIRYEGTLGQISSPIHSLYPADSAVLYISGDDCNSCLYIPNDGSSLTMGTMYYVRVRAYNALGGSEVVASSGSEDGSQIASVTPNQVRPKVQQKKRGCCPPLRRRRGELADTA